MPSCSLLLSSAGIKPFMWKSPQQTQQVCAWISVVRLWTTHFSCGCWCAFGRVKWHHKAFRWLYSLIFLKVNSFFFKSIHMLESWAPCLYPSLPFVCPLLRISHWFINKKGCKYILRDFSNVIFRINLFGTKDSSKKHLASDNKTAILRTCFTPKLLWPGGIFGRQ